jgi:hypothetical protein
MNSVNDLETPDDASLLCELFLVVRPEDKAAVWRALEGEIGSTFISYHAVGRGFDGGLAYGKQGSKLGWLRWLNRSQILAFLPKIVFWAVLERESAKRVIERVGAAVRLTGGPSECAGGFAILAAMEEELPLGAALSGARRRDTEASIPSLQHRQEGVLR